MVSAAHGAGNQAQVQGAAADCAPDGGATSPA